MFFSQTPLLNIPELLSPTEFNQMHLLIASLFLPKIFWLKRLIFCCTISEKLSETCESLEEKNLYEFLCLSFGKEVLYLRLKRQLKHPWFWYVFSYKDIYEINENTNFSLRKLCIRIIIHLGDMIFMEATLMELLMALDTLIYSLQSLVFLINIQKSVFNPHWLWNF